MERIDRILKHVRFQECKNIISQAELQRSYCKHGMEHSLDVARIAYILNLEEQAGLNQEVIYAMALLHDLGRSVEYRGGGSHHEAGVGLAEEILADCAFTPEEIRWITEAIAGHKDEQRMKNPNADCMEPGEVYRRLLYRADKLSRNCFDCEASATCYWPDAKRNHTITY